MLVVLLTSSASSAGVHKAERSKAPVAVTNVLASCDGKPAFDTHGGLN